MSESNDSGVPEEEPEPDPELEELLRFEPAPRRFKRADGWTAALQRKFIAKLAETGSPRLAAQALGKDRFGIEKVYKSEGAEGFRAAWDGVVALYERRAAERIEAVHAPLAAATPPGVDRRRKVHPQPGPLPQAGEGEAAPRDPLPVVCDLCAATGLAGDAQFAAIRDILDFEPVPRRPHDRHWDEQTQRAFVAALALAGSPAKAARSVGRHAFGADKLRKARGGRAFAEACDAALEIARDREFAHLGGTLGALASEAPSASDGAGADEDWDDGAFKDEDEDGLAGRVEDAQDRCVQRLLSARRLYLWEIYPEPAKRAAWEALCGPVDWDRVPQFAAQDNEPHSPNMREPDMLLATEHQWLAELTGGPDKSKVMGRAIEHLSKEIGRDADE